MINTLLKRCFDSFVSITLLIVLLPICSLIALLIYLEDKGKVFFIQERIGKNGKTFNLIKFRSMSEHSENLGSGLYSYDNDPRVTKIGKLLRKTSLDELPQLINVIRGEMSIVGPRPPVTYELGSWGDYTPDMLLRFNVKPGITGLAQVSGRNENNWDEKIKLDNEYIRLFERYGILIDFKLLLKTVYVVLVGKDTVEKDSNEREGPISRKARQAANEHLNGNG